MDTSRSVVVRFSESPAGIGELAVFVAVLAIFTSGACGLLYQVASTRKLVLLSTAAYAVSTVLSIYFLAWLGSLGRRWRTEQ